METLVVQSNDRSEFQRMVTSELNRIEHQGCKVTQPVQFSTGMFNRDVVKVGGYNKEYEAIKNATNPDYDPYDYSFSALIIYE